MRHISNHLDYTKASKKADDEWIGTQLRIVGPVAPEAVGAVPASQASPALSPRTSAGVKIGGGPPQVRTAPRRL
ncbi:hypothetical protein AB0D35_24925 [Streptomyces sp. NPDC048301]|uniref:hypothetical protein n=1 Tax=Streptomyces sp. NPDC048301 TaxID=3155631 RepID=UPI0034288809